MGKEKNPQFSDSVSALIRELRLPVGFPREVVEEADRLPAEIPADDLCRRLDLRNEVTVTIDGENARDFDDAVSVARLPGGGYRLRVSIADVSFYVRPGSVVDQEAFRRGTSVYFPDRVLPMLPERLSNDLCSLVPHQDRPTWTATIDFDPDGNRRRAEFHRSVIRSAARLTYTIVRKVLVDRNSETRRQWASLIGPLEVMGELAELIAARRRERGSLDFDLPEPEIVLDIEEGGIDRIVRAERNMAHRLIEEFMIAANEAVAEFVTSRGRPMIYRVHGTPVPEKVRIFAEMLHNLGLPAKFGRKPEPKSFVQVIEGARGRPVERLVNTLLLRTMGRAVYQPENDGHFGLASRCYTHFTSPIRRYPDLIVHRILGLAGQTPAVHPSDRTDGSGYSISQLKKIATHSSETERAGMKAEWAVRDLAAAWFMKDKAGERHRGIISNVTKFGFFVELESYFLEGLVSMRSLKDDYYIFSEKHHQLVGKKKKRRFRTGDAVSVVVKGSNIEKRWVDLKVENGM